MRVHLILAACAVISAGISPPAQAETVPYGSYMASCREIRMVAGWLRASCQDRKGRWVEANTAPSWCRPGQDIANEDGRLVCR